MGSKEVAIKLYMHHMCPACHRVLIILTELNIPFEKEILDLNVPRSPDYLKINPRGLVPAISYDGEIITESAIISQFLVDTYPSHLLPASSDPKGPLIRARIGFFVDAWTTLCTGPYVKVLLARTEKEANEHVDLFAKTIAEEIDPLLKDAAPFFGGSDKLTFAEVFIKQRSFSSVAGQSVTTVTTILDELVTPGKVVSRQQVPHDQACPSMPLPYRFCETPAVYLRRGSEASQDPIPVQFAPTLKEALNVAPIGTESALGMKTGEDSRIEAMWCARADKTVPRTVPRMIPMTTMDTTRTSRIRHFRSMRL
ncbi:hypothetical protein VPNG_03649 [Cytospora leucostoma]|uniref:GST N-terminal domain-containing protein n=1 Tax=Cytospora leucostoma TaxID=1230097 RepID=A0A423XCQ3_9PEZI|nr:hypothetical protein VPNG_03649 [Cytospora leucostoma]